MEFGKLNNNLAKKHTADGSNCGGYDSLLACILVNPNKTLYYNGHGYSDAPPSEIYHWCTVFSFGYNPNGINVFFSPNGGTNIFKRKIVNSEWVGDWTSF